MIKALIRVRFRALFAALFQQSRRKRRQSKGMAVLFAILFIYVAFVFFGLFTIMFQQLVEPYHALGLDWLYFATAGLTGLAFSILGSVFATQSQLYDAKDNDLLLSMPIRPRLILFSRMVPLLALNLLFSAMSMVPAGVIYGANVGFAPGGFVAYLLSTLALPFLAQAITCLLGWLLHQLLQRMNKSLASALYLLVFMAVYFYVYTQASQLLNAMASNGEAMANALRSWAWPLYAMGQGCTGGLPFLAGFLAVTAAAFGLVYWFLSVTFMHSAFLRRSVKKGRKVDFGRLETRSAVQALHRREMKRFLGCPAYLTNLGFGLVMIAAVAVAGLIFRRQILDFLNPIPELNALAPLLVAACLGFMISCTCISTPSVSLEGKTHLDPAVHALDSPADSPVQALAPLRPGGSPVGAVRSGAGLGLWIQPGGYGAQRPVSGGLGISVRRPGPGVRPAMGPAGLAQRGLSLQAVRCPDGHHVRPHGPAAYRRAALRLLCCTAWFPPPSFWPGLPWFSFCSPPFCTALP